MEIKVTFTVRKGADDLITVSYKDRKEDNEGIEAITTTSMQEAAEVTNKLRDGTFSNIDKNLLEETMLEEIKKLNEGLANILELVREIKK